MATTRRRPARAAVSRETRIAYGEIQRDAGARIRKLQMDARRQLATLKGRHREVARILDRVTSAAEGSWRQVKKSADAVLADAVNIAASLVKRLKKSLPR